MAKAILMKAILEKEVGVSAITIKPEDIAVTLKRMREAAGLSQLQVARKAGFSSGTTVSNYEQGLRAMDPEKLNKILAVYGMAVATITFRKIASFDIDEAEIIPDYIYDSLI